MEDLVIENDGATSNPLPVTNVETRKEQDSGTRNLEAKMNVSDHETELETRIKTLEAEKLQLINLLSHSQSVQDSHSKTVEVEADSRRPPAVGHIAASIMSLSTGSEESAVEDEKFVKIKPCEMESGSSKASSQSGKENLELEEHIQSLNEQLESTKKALTDKEEECKGIKYQLEAVLLEKNVESQSISSLSSDLKSVKATLVVKDEQMDEVNLVLDDVLEQFKPYLPLDERENDDSLEDKLSLLKCLPNQFKSIEVDGEGLARAYILAQAELKELQDQQSEIIGGYQLITQNYEKLQAEFEEYKGESESSQQMKDELERFREELLSKDEDLMEIQLRSDTFEEELNHKTKEHELAVKDFTEYRATTESALAESESKSDELQELLLKKTEELEKLSQNFSQFETYVSKEFENFEQRFDKYQQQTDASSEEGSFNKTRIRELQDQLSETKLLLEQKTKEVNSIENEFKEFRALTEFAVEEATTEKALLQSQLDEYQQLVSQKTQEIESLQIEFNRSVELASEVKPPNASKSIELQSTSVVSSSRVATLQNTCFEKLRVLNLDYHQLQQNYTTVMSENTELHSKFSSVTSELQLKNEVLEDLRTELEEIKTCVAFKTNQINDTVQAKNIEIERLMAAYESYAERTEKTVADLTSTVNTKTEVITQLENSLDSMRQEQETLTREREQFRIMGWKQTESLHSNISSQLAQIEELQEELRSSDAVLEDSYQKVQDLTSQLRSKEEAMVELTEVSDARSREVQDLTEKLASVTSLRTEEVNNLRSELISQLKAKDEKIGELVEISDLRSREVKNLKLDLTAQLKLKDETISELEQIVQIRADEVNQVKTEVLLVNNVRSAEVSDLKEQLAKVKSGAEAQERECVYLRTEQARLATLWSTTKDLVREEYVNKLKEEELLRESELLLLQQQISTNEEELGKVEASWKVALAELAVLREDKLLLNKEVERMKTKEKGMEGQLESLKGQLHMKAQVESDCERLKREVEQLTRLLVVTEEELVREKLKVVKSSQIEEPTEIESIVNEEVLLNQKELEEELVTIRDELSRKERKMELLQTKITEIENSEMKAFEESFVLKNLIKQLELHNERLQNEISTLLNSVVKDPSVHPKVMKIQDELIRLIYVLDERDKRCVELTIEITRLLEERDELQLKLSSVLKHNVELTMAIGGSTPLKHGSMYDKKDLESKLAQLEDTNFRMHIDLKRERETRKLVQQELQYSQAARMYRERVPPAPDVLGHAPPVLDPVSVRKESLEVVHI